MPLIWSLNELALWAEKLLAGGKDFQKLSVSGSTTKTSHQCAVSAHEILLPRFHQRGIAVILLSVQAPTKDREPVYSSFRR